MTALKFLVKTFLVFIVFTLIGQIRVRNETLETRYHHYVNSEGFQQGFERITRPATWTYEKVSEAVQRHVPEQAR